MSENLPVLHLGEKHKNLIDCMRMFPHVADVFRNIYYQRPLDSHIRITEMKTLDLLIDALFIPLLISSEIIVKDPSTPTKYRALVQSFRPEDMGESDIGHMALNGMTEIVNTFDEPKDRSKRVAAYVTGEFPDGFGEKIVSIIRDQAKEVLETPNSTDPNRKKLSLALAVDVSDLGDK